MKVFITGASGYIGTHLTRRLSHEGHFVTILVRNVNAAREFAENNVTIINGDIFDKEKLKSGMDGCDWVFHLAAYAKPTSVDKTLPYRTNVEGTKNVLEAASAAGAKKVVFTSTGGTMGFSIDGRAVDEETNKNPEYHTEYEKTKSQAEKLAISSSTPATKVTIVNPTRVFGPGKLSKSNSITRIMKLYVMGLWRIIPGDGTAIGNYSFIEDVVSGHILAAQYGRGGERYILGGENVSFSRLFEELGRAYGSNRKMIKISAGNLKKVANLTGTVGSVFGKPALISGNWIDKYLQNWILSSCKAENDLSYKITPFREAIDTTVRWIESGGRINGQ